MEGILYGLIFIIGALFGSFFTLAVYRIPLGENILYKHSFCPNCKEKLRFKDLIPILSYIFLGGKCAYCGQRIRPRYLILEIFSGLVFVLFAFSIKLSIFNISFNSIFYFTFFILYIASLFIIAGIDKENISIQSSVLYFGAILSLIYMTYVCIHNLQAIYTYIIYFVLLIVLLLVNSYIKNKKQSKQYIVGCMMLTIYMCVFTGILVTYLSMIISLLITFIRIMIKKLYSKNNEKTKIPFGFYLCVSNIFLIILFNFLQSYVF